MAAAVTFTDGTTAGVVSKDVIQDLSTKILKVNVPATFVWGTDILSIDLTKYGCLKLAGVLAFEETTAGSVAAATTVTTSVASGVATITSTSGAAAKIGSFLIFAY